MSSPTAYENRFKNTENAEKYASRFERPTHRHINRREQCAVRKALGQIDADGGPRSILDMPSGAGRFLPVLMKPGRLVLEMDVAHEMLALSRQRTGSTAGVRWAQGDAFTLPLADDAVECIFCNRLLHHFHTPAERIQLLREMRRVTRRHIIVSFFDYHRFGSLRLMLKRLRGRRPDYSGHPTRAAFEQEVAEAGLRLRAIIPTGPVWVAQVYWVLEKQQG